MIDIHVEPALFVFLGPRAAQVGWRLKQRLHQTYGSLPIWRFLWVNAGPIAGTEAEHWIGEEEQSEAGPALGERLGTTMEALQRRETLEATEALSDESVRYVVERAEGRVGARVYVVFGLGDREASIASFEVAYLCRYLLGETKQTVVGVSFLPSLEEDVVDEVQRERLHANAYAWFREHESLLHNPSWEVQRPGRERVKLEVPPFDLSFVVDRGNQAGEQFASADEAYAMVAQALALFVGAPSAAVMPLGDKPGVLRTRFKDRVRAYSSLAASSLVYPQEKVLGYCRASLAGAMLGDGLLAEPSAGQVRATAQELLMQMRLNEEEILKALRAGCQEPSDEPLGVPEPATVQAILGLAQAREERNALKLQEQELKMAEAAAELQGRVMATLEAKMADLVINRGVPFARAVLGLLRAEASQPESDMPLSFPGLKARLSQQRMEALEEARGRRQAAQERLSRLDRGIRQALRKALTPRAWRRDLDASRDELLRWVGEIGRLTFALAIQRQACTLCDQLGAEAEKLDGRLAGVQRTLERARESLGRLAESSLQEPVAAQGIFQLSVEALGAGYIRRYYGGRVQALSPLLAYRDWAGELAGKTLADLEAWQEADIVQQLQQRANVYFVQDVQGVSLLEAMDFHYGMQSPAMMEIQFSDLLRRCQPFWRYDPNSAIRPYEGQGVFGVEDASSSLVPGRYRGGREHHLVSTQSRQRIEVVYAQHGLPAFLLRDMAAYKACYEKRLREGEKTLHVLPPEQLTVDVFPDRHWEAREAFALAAALDMIVQIGGWHYFDPQREYVRAHLRPARDFLIDQRRDWAEEAFVLRADWVQQARELVEQELASLGREEAIRLLDEHIAHHRALLAGEMPDELRRQYEREIRILEERRLQLLGE